MLYEIDEFEKYENLLVEKVSQGKIDIFKQYLIYKKDVIQKFRNMIFGRPLLEQKDAENLAYSYFYPFMRGVEISYNDKTFILNYPPNIVLSLNGKCTKSGVVAAHINNIKDTIHDAYNFELKAIKTCYKILNPNFTEIDAIPFEDLNIPECLKTLLFEENSSEFYQSQLGLISNSTPILLQCMIFFDYFDFSFDSEIDMLFYDMWLEFYEKTQFLGYDLSNNAFVITQPWQDHVCINGTEITIDDLKDN